MSFFKVPENITSVEFEGKFGPFVPLLVPWTDLLRHEHEACVSLLQGLKDLLKAQFLHVTVVQHKDGLLATSGKKLRGLLKDIHLLVLSSGGTGNIPIPLLKQEEEIRANSISAGHEIVFAGTAKRSIRHFVLKNLQTLMGTELIIYHGPEWRDALAKARFVLAPRGNGPSSFMLYECILMGYVPIYVWEGKEWLPYKGSPTADLRRLGISVHVSQVSKIPLIIRNISKSEWEGRRLKLIALRHSHFTYAGVLRQIWNFLHKPCEAELHVEHPLESI